MAVSFQKVAGGRGWALVDRPFKEEFRFGHKPWHRVALLVAAILCAFIALGAGAGGAVGVSAGFGGAAALLGFLAFWRAGRIGRPDRPDPH
jgi:hypothetical protein